MPNFRYEPMENMSFYLPMFQVMMDELGSGKADMVLPPPTREALSPTALNFWFAFNAMAYGIKKGLALAGAGLEVTPQNGEIY